MADKKIILVLENQSLYDIALQEYGSVEGVTILVADNLLNGVDAEVETNQQLAITPSKVINKDVVNYFIKNSKKPASHDTDNGIGEEGFAFTDGFTIGFES